MSITVDISEDQGVRVAEDHVETHPPDRLSFTVEGALSMSEQLLGTFEGTTLNPSQIELSVTESESVEIDLTEDPSLQLASVDVGIETPDADVLSREIDTVRSTVSDPTELVDARPAALAFTIEGSILDVSEETLEMLSEGDPAPESLTFAVDDTVRSDGGVDDDDVMLEISLFGFGTTIRRDGTIVIGTRGRSTGIDLR